MRKTEAVIDPEHNNTRYIRLNIFQDIKIIKTYHTLNMFERTIHLIETIYARGAGRFRVLYLIAIIEILLSISWSVYTGEGEKVFIDTPFYYDSYNTIISGRPDIARTPIYPLVIGLPRSLFGATVSVVMVYLFQGILFVCSIRWIGGVLENITSHKVISYWFTAVYALYPGIVSMCGIMMTESMTVSLVSAVLYLTSEAYYKKSGKMALFSGFTSILLWLLRPSLIVVPIALALMWLSMAVFEGRSSRKVVLCGVSAAIISLACAASYAAIFNHYYHKVTLSQIPTMNNYMTLRQAKAIDTDRIEHSQLKASLDSVLKAEGDDSVICGQWWNDAYYISTEYGMMEFDKFVSDQMKAHTGELLTYIYRERIEGLLNSNCVYTGGAIPGVLKSLTRLVRVNNGTAFLIYVIAIAILLYTDIRSKHISYFMWMLSALFAANYLIVLIGAPNDFTRLLAQNYPVLIAISCRELDGLISLATGRQ